jgi:hypothetical protein
MHPSRFVAPWSMLLAALGVCLADHAIGASNPVISFDLTQSQFTATGNATFIFDGTVTNNSGTALNASDFFFNFSAFDPTAINPIQELGVSSDFSIPNGGTSAAVDLFDITFTAPSHSHVFPVIVQLEDINNDLSAPQTIEIAFKGATTGVPEPDTPVLLGSALIALLVSARCGGGRAP